MKSSRIKKALVTSLVVGATTLYSSFSSLAETINLTGGRQTIDLSLSDKQYVGNMPTDRIEDLKKDILASGKIPTGVMDDSYTIITGINIPQGSSWGNQITLSNVQIENLESLGYIGGSGHELHNSVVYSNVDGNMGLEVANQGTPVRNNIFLGLDQAIILADGNTGPNPTDIYDNLLAFNEVAMNIIVTSQLQKGENIFFNNTWNVDAYHVKEEFPVIVEGNYWYDGTVFKDTEAGILNTVRLNTGSIKTTMKDKSDFVDVVPFKTNVPFQPVAMPTSSTAGLVGLAGIIGVAGLYSLRRKDE